MKNSLYQELFIENKQLFRIMKIIVYVCFLCVGNLLAIGSYAQTAHVTIVSNHITIGQVINEIEKQTDYLFVFNVKDINIKRNVKVNAKDKAVNEVLNDIFPGRICTVVMRTAPVFPDEAIRRGTLRA